MSGPTGVVVAAGSAPSTFALGAGAAVHLGLLVGLLVGLVAFLIGIIGKLTLLGIVAVVSVAATAAIPPPVVGVLVLCLFFLGIQIVDSVADTALQPLSIFLILF